MTPSTPEDGAEAQVMPMLLGMHWHEDSPGGLNRYLSDLHVALRSAGIPAKSVVLGPALDSPPGVLAVSRFDLPLLSRLWGFAREAKRGASKEVTVLDAHFALYAVGSLLTRRLRRLPLVAHFQGPWAEESRASGEQRNWRIVVKRHVELLVYRRARVIVVLSDAFKHVLVKGYGLAPWFIEVVPPGVDLTRFYPGNRETARVMLHLSNDVPVVVAVRRLVPRVGLDILIEAWADLHATIPEARLLVVGDGPERRGLTDLVQVLGVAPSVRFLGFADDETVVSCYQAADISVVPTVALEGFGLVVLESLACGTPAIVTDSGGLPEAVVGLDPSLVVTAGDPLALSRRLRSALDGTQELPSRSRCRTYSESFAWPAVAERHRAIYAEAAKSRRADRKIRVVYLDHCAQLSGGELALLRLLPALHDVDSHVILGEDGPLVGRLRQCGISVEVLKMAEIARSLGRARVQPGLLPASALARSAGYVARLALRIRRLRPDLVHTNSLKAALYGGVAAKLAGVPQIWHLHDRISVDYLPSSTCLLIRATARLLPTAVIANSYVTRDTLGRVKPDHMVIPPPLGFVPAPRPPSSRGSPLRLGIVGRLDPWKGQDVFIDAFARAFPGGMETASIIGASLFGESGYERRLERQAKELGLEARVEFRGFREDVEEELRRLDVLVHASTIPEPFGQVVVEGMAAGLPVVASRAGGPAEIITDGVDGFLYPPGDADTLARLLQRLGADPVLRDRVGTAAVLRAGDFTADQIAQQTMELYKKITCRVTT